jgi:hypothetical protein
MLMYDKEFVFRDHGFDWIPDYINRDLLLNVSFDTESEEVKLYILDSSKQFLYKITRAGITKQYNALAYRAETSKLSRFLRTDFDYDDLRVDAIEGDVYYVYIEGTSQRQYIKFLSSVCARYGIVQTDFIKHVNKINKLNVENIYQCSVRRAISLVKVPLLSRSLKIYSRPFKTGNLYEFDGRTTDFLTKLYRCAKDELRIYTTDLWVASELFSQRTLIITQSKVR